MPTYEYKCSSCNHEFEKFHGINAEPVKICPQCGAETVERLMSGGAGIMFKGSGFYVTDYKKSSATSAKSEAPKCSSADSSSCCASCQKAAGAE